jgi:hypothetical protein
MTFQYQYLGFFVLFVIHYILISIFPTIHSLCLFGGMINILINIGSINPRQKSRIYLKSEVSNEDEPDFSVQFHNLYRGFKYGVSGYIITIGIMPYYLYLCVNPGKNFESFKSDTINFVTNAYYSIMNKCT